MEKHDFERDYFTIKEFSEIVGLPVATLRYYDKEGIFCPAMHGTGSKSKYRYYTLEQITAVNLVRVLTKVGIPLRRVKRVVPTRTPNKTLKDLSRQMNVVIEKLQFYNEALSIIGIYREHIFEGLCASESEIVASEMPEKRIIMGTQNNFIDSNTFYREFNRFCHEPHSQKVTLSCPIGGYFESMDSFLSNPSQPTKFFSIDPKGEDKKAAGLYLVGYTRGYYGQANDLPERMVAFADENGYAFTGAVYCTYPFDEVSITKPSQYLLQTAASVTMI